MDDRGGGGDPPGWRAAVRGLLAVRPGPWAVGPALRAVVAAGLVLAVSMLFSDLRVGGIAYLGVACATNFIGDGDYRARAARGVGQAVGASIGMTIGALVPDTAACVVAASVVVGVLAGMVGRIGPASTAGAVMVVVGVAYTQFDRLAMPWWEPVLAYLSGSALLLAMSLIGALFHRERYRRAAVAAVFDAAADVLDATADPSGGDARHRLAIASTAARVAVVGYRLRPVPGPVIAAWSEAHDAADRAARALVDPEPMTAEDASEQGRRWRVQAEELRTGRLERYRTATTVPLVSPPGSRVAAGIRPAIGPEGLQTGARIGVCIGLATALAVALHPPQHAFWIPLTVAVVLRPEYGAVTSRSVHRLAGTIVGVTVVAALLALTSSPAWLSVAAALALGVAACSLPRFYGVAVVGITGSALLSIAVGDPGAVEPWARMLDTVLGCAVVLVVGVALWPRRGLPDEGRAFGTAVGALARQIELELRSDTDADASARAAATDQAYRSAHAWRAELERDLVEPDPAHTAAAWLPVAIQLERTVDAVCASTGRPRAAGGRNPDDVRRELASLFLARPTTPAAASRLLTTIVTGPLGETTP